MALHWLKWMFSILIHCQHLESVRGSNLLFNGKQSFYSALEVLSILCRHIIEKKQIKRSAMGDELGFIFFLWPLRFIAVSFQFFWCDFRHYISHLALVVIKFNQSTHSTVSCANINHSSNITQGNRLFQTQTRTAQHIKFHIKSTCNGKWSKFLLCHEFKGYKKPLSIYQRRIKLLLLNFPCSRVVHFKFLLISSDFFSKFLRNIGA